MQLKDYLTRHLIFFEEKPLSKEESIKLLCRRIADDQQLDAPSLFGEVMERENKMTTGMGSHIAVPHARIDSLDRFHTACLVSKNGIDFDALDEKLVHIVVLLLSPKRMVKEHIALLSKISYFLTDKENFKKIMETSSIEEIQEMVRLY